MERQAEPPRAAVALEAARAARVHQLPVAWAHRASPALDRLVGGAVSQDRAVVLAAQPGLQVTPARQTLTAAAAAEAVSQSKQAATAVPQAAAREVAAGALVTVALAATVKSVSRGSYRP